MLDDGTQAEQPPEVPEEKPVPVKKNEAKIAAKIAKEKPPVEESLQTQKDIHVSFESPIEEASKT